MPCSALETAEEDKANQTRTAVRPLANAQPHTCWALTHYENLAQTFSKDSLANHCLSVSNSNWRPSMVRPP